MAADDRGAYFLGGKHGVDRRGIIIQRRKPVRFRPAMPRQVGRDNQALSGQPPQQGGIDPGVIGGPVDQHHRRGPFLSGGPVADFPFHAFSSAQFNGHGHTPFFPQQILLPR